MRTKDSKLSKGGNEGIKIKDKIEEKFEFEKSLVRMQKY